MLIHLIQQLVQLQLPLHCMPTPMHLSEHNPYLLCQNPAYALVFRNNPNAILVPVKAHNFIVIGCFARRRKKEIKKI